MGHRPVRCRDKFPLTWTKRSEICFVTSSGLINYRVELEVDLIQTSGEWIARAWP